MTDDSPLAVSYPAVSRKKVTAAFDGGRLSSDSGVMLLSLAERQRGVAKTLAALIADRRDPAHITHTVEDVLKARILAIACGYSDGNDFDWLRFDPAFKLACGRLPDTGSDLCSQPTISRWENAPTLKEIIRLTYALVDIWCWSHKTPPASVVLDIDDTLDVVHGHQKLSEWNAHYDERCFLPIHIYETATGRPVAMILRPGKTPSGKEVRALLRRLINRIRRHWPATRITIRGDSHYGREEAMSWCEANNVDYVFGFAGNTVLDRLVEPEADDIRTRRAEEQLVILRGFAETRYAAKSWTRERRVVARIEASSSDEDDMLICDPLTEVLRSGARALLAQAVEAEVAEALAAHAHLTTDDGRRRLVRHGHMPERTIQTGIGPVAVRQPRVRDRGDADGERIRFSSTLLPPYARRTKSLDALLPILYLRGISSGDMQEALAALLGKDAPNLSSAALTRLKAGWQEEFERWKGRDLSARRYVYIWADGIYLQARMEPDKQCILVLIGATPEGKKELIGFQTGYRESTQSRSELLADLKARGLAVPPQLAIGDGALGFWKALEQEFGATRQQRCWVHKTMNVLNKLPKSVQPKAKADLKEIWMAEGRADAEKAFDRFLTKYEAKYDKAAACLAKDREALLAFYDFPAEHWKHIRTSNPIESTFATVRHRTTRGKGCLSHDTGVIMVFKMIQTAQSSWRRLDGQNQLPKLITGIKFTDGIEAGHRDAA